MSENFVSPTYYNLQRATIRSEFSGLGEFDITLLIPSITFVSSIESETMYGSAKIIDSVGLLDGTDSRPPLRGEEQIIFEIADSKIINENGGINNIIPDNLYRFVGYVYKIDNVETKEINDSMSYDIHFVSYQSFKAGTYKITRAFIDKPVSSIVETIFKDYYRNNDTLGYIPSQDRKDLFLEQTQGVYRCTIPKMRSEEAMDFLSKRSYSNLSPSCLFRFFENSRGYHYVTDEELYRLADADETRKFTFTYGDAIPNALDYFDSQLNNLEVLGSPKRVNSFDDIYNGAYNNKVYEIDILSRRLNLLDNTNQYKYFEERDRYLSKGKFQQFVDRHSNNFIDSIHRGSEDVQKSWLVIQNYTEGEKSGENAMQAETFYAEIISNRQAYKKHIESITINARGPGRLDVTAGDIVTLDIKQLRFADNSESLEPNKHLSGEYIVKSVVHLMDKEEMYNEYVLIKREWSQTRTDQEAVSSAILGRNTISFSTLQSSVQNNIGFSIGEEVNE